jgi:hypothetical protein
MEKIYVQSFHNNNYLKKINTKFCHAKSLPMKTFMKHFGGKFFLRKNRKHFGAKDFLK